MDECDGFDAMKRRVPTAQIKQMRACCKHDGAMELKPIHTKSDRKAALRLVSKLVDPDPARGTREGDMLEVMFTLVAAYEARHFQIETADPPEAIKFRMDQQGLVPGEKSRPKA